MKAFVHSWFLALFLSSSVHARPNIILIMADDLGYETIGANGGISYATPELDQLAESGARFTNCFVQPLCTPTRCQLMTGLYNVRNYIEFGILDPEATTFGNLFKEAGYNTCIVGKWQLGRDKNLPQHFGFDESCLWQLTRRPPRYANPGLEINGEERDYYSGEYGPDLVTDYAIDFITRNQAEEFFLYYPMLLTHAPFQPPPDSKDWDPRTIGEKALRHRRHFKDMVEYMDKNIGRIVAHLEKLHLRNNTLLIFLGDNGTTRGIRSNIGDRIVVGAKGKTTEAGMHVPLIVNWPTHIKPSVCKELVDSTDFLPTILEVAEVQAAPSLKLDGVSFLPQLLGHPGKSRKWIYSWYCPRPIQDKTVKEFAFDKRYKLYRSGEFFDFRKDSLEEQPLQVAELSEVQANAARDLQRVLDQFNNARPGGLATDANKTSGDIDDTL